MCYMLYHIFSVTLLKIKTQYITDQKSSNDIQQFLKECEYMINIYKTHLKTKPKYTNERLTFFEVLGSILCSSLGGDNFEAHYY